MKLEYHDESEYIQYSYDEVRYQYNDIAVCTQSTGSCNQANIAVLTPLLYDESRAVPDKQGDQYMHLLETMNACQNVRGDGGLRR